MISPQYKGSLFAIASGVMYGLLGYFGMTIVHENWSVHNMLMWRFLISSLFIGALIIPKLRTLHDSWCEMLKVVLYGMIFYGPTSIIYFIASQSIGTGLAMVIFFTFPAMVMFLNWIMHRKPIATAYFSALALILLGMFFLVGANGGSFDVFGVGLGLVSALFYAFYMVVSKNNKVSPYVSTLMVSIGCMLTAFICALIDHSFVMPMTFMLWKNLLCMGIISTALPILLMLEAFRFISAEKASILSVFEPVCVVISGILFLDEHLSPFQGIGVVAILIGVLITLYSKSTSE